MKKLILFVLLTVLFVFIASPAYAQGAEYVLDEIGVTVTAPDGYFTITRNTPKNDKVFDDVGANPDSVLAYMKAQSIYLNAIDPESGNEIVITSIDSTIDDYNSFSDTSLNALASMIVNEFESLGIEVSSYKFYSHSKARFIVLYHYNSVTDAHAIQYNTVFGGKTVNFTFFSYSKHITTDEERMVKLFVEGSKFAGEAAAGPAIEYTRSFRYTDEESRASFTLPNNWKIAKEYAESDPNDVMFDSTVEQGLSIIFTSLDVYGLMTDEERGDTKRYEMNNEYFSYFDVASVLQASVFDISKATYGPYEYFVATSDYPFDISGFTATIKVTNVITFTNGWMYLFQFCADKTNPYYSDFEAVLRSCDYPYVTPASDRVKKNVEKDDGGDSLLAVYIAVVAVIAIASVIITALVVKRKRAKEKVYYANRFIDQPDKEQFTSLRCVRCGADNPIEHNFCAVCGAELKK